MEKELKRVDIIRPGSINAIIGPVGTLKRMLKNQEYFNTCGYQVTVFTNESLRIGPILNPPQAVKPSVTWKSKIRKKIGSVIRMKAKKNKILAVWLYKKELKKAERLVNYYIKLNRNPDIVQFHSNEECYYYLKYRKETKAQIVMFMHSDGIPFAMDLQYYPILKGTSFISSMQKALDYTVEKTNRLGFICKIGQKNFLNYYPTKKESDTSVIINGIDDLTNEQKKEVNEIRENCSVSKYKYRLCCTGTINTRKGQRYIIEAVHGLPSDLRQQIHVDFIGDGGERPVLEELVKQYGLEENVNFYGLIPNVDVYKYLALNNIYILMSKNEGLPISIIEAMRAGLPIISTNVSGIPELVKVGYNGFLLEPDAKQLKDLLSKLPEYDWIKMGCNSRIRFEQEFTFERMKKEFCDMYNLILEK